MDESEDADWKGNCERDGKWKKVKEETWERECKNGNKNEKEEA